jgi:hypothetical protein
MRPATCRRFAAFSHLFLSLCAVAQSPVPTKERTAEQMELMIEAKKWSEETKKLRRQGKLKEAIQAAEKMLDAELKVFGELHDDPIGSLVQIAELREQLEEFLAAKEVYQRVVELQTKRFGKGDWRVTDARIASEGMDLRDKLDAASRKELGEAISQQLQLHAEYGKGNSAQAAKLGEAIVAIDRKVLGEAHPDYATSLNNLAALYNSMGQHAKTEPLLLEAVSRIIDHVESNSEGQSEAAQLARTSSIRPYLDNLLSGTTKVSSPKVYDAVLRLRGSVTQRQVFLRSIRNAKPELKPLIEQLQRTCSRMSQLSTMPYDPKRKADLPAELRKLEEDRQKQEAELASQSDEFAEYQKRKKLTGADLRKMLPEGTVLIEFLQYKANLCAFVIDREKIQRVELGKVAPIETAIDAFRDQLLGEKPKPVAEKDDPRTVLAEKLWQPVAKLFGTPKVVLICPDGPLCRLPFAALPGSDPKKYLIDEVNLVTVPVPSMLPDLLAPRPKAEASSLLGVGQVDFGKLPRSERRFPSYPARPRN